MPFLRFMNFPVAAFAFMLLYVAAHKAPHVVGMGSMIGWTVLPLVIVAVVCGQCRKTSGLERDNTES